MSDVLDNFTIENYLARAESNGQQGIAAILREALTTRRKSR